MYKPEENRKKRKETEKQINHSLESARKKLKKLILFDFSKKLGLDNCFRCGLPITNIQEFSIEHKIPWLHAPNAEELYFDLNNIAFSHLNCNIKCHRPPKNKTPRHPHPSIGYYNSGCRCDDCKKLCREANRRRTKKKEQREREKQRKERRVFVCVETGKMYTNVNDAIKDTNLTKTTINKHLRNGLKKRKFIFKHELENE